MFAKTLRDIAKPQVAAILELIKRSTGLAVSEISRSLGMSYMGVKQYCIELEKKGYLETWRRPKKVGRPEKTYRLTAKAQALFPKADNELTLELLQIIQQVYGPTAAEKLLFNYFSKKAEAYLKKVRGKSVAERAIALAKLRESEGYCSQVDYDKEAGIRITEFHSPYQELSHRFPSITRMEENMFQRILQTGVHRGEEKVSCSTKTIFAIDTILQPREQHSADEEQASLAL